VGGASYLDVATGVTTFLLAGRYFEASTRRRTGSALRSLAAIGAKDVAVLDAAGSEHRRPVTELVVGSQFVVRPGEAVVTDGQVVSGHCSIDRSAMTGESLPVDAGPGDAVVGGTVAVGGRLVVRATKVGADTQLAQMVRLVEEAQNEKADLQRLADRLSGVFVPAVILAAGLTLAGWLVSGGPSEQAVNAALSVLIIACPCALGLATPMALLVASGEGARRGIFFKGYQGLEASRRVDTVVLDKTGTVTTGHMELTDVEVVPGVERAELLRWAGALEQASEHLVALAITGAARDELGELAPVDQFVATPGLGACGQVEGHLISVGRPELFSGTGLALDDGLATRCAALGRTTVLVGRDDAVVGALAVADMVRPSAASAVRQLRSLGLGCILLSGDNQPTARAVGDAIGVSEVVAGVSPPDKVAFIRRLQAAGRSVAMVGDGVNDGPALATAQLGLAIGSGTDVAINAADVIVVRDDLNSVVTAIALARRTIATIRGNLAWAFAYNMAALPLAACGLLNPLIAGAAMAFSSAFVVWNSARLRRFSPFEAERASSAGRRASLPEVRPAT
jgi:heavy metal translocating P-type ATPase